MTIYRLPDELINVIVEFSSQIKSMILTCKWWCSVIITRDDYDEMVDKRTNPIMSLHSHFPDKFDIKWLVENTKITKKLYGKLARELHVGFYDYYPINMRYVLDFYDYGFVEVKNKYGLEEAHGLTLERVLSIDYKWDFNYLSHLGVITEEDYRAYPQLIDYVVLYHSKNLTVDKVKKMVSFAEQNEQIGYQLIPECFCDNPSLNLDDILNNLDYFDITGDAPPLFDHPSWTIEHFEKYKYVIDDLMYHLSHNKYFVGRLTKEDVLKYDWELEVLSHNINYEVVVETIDLKWNFYEVLVGSNMPFAIYKKYFSTYDIAYYCSNGGLKWRDVVENPELNWDFNVICKNRAFN